MEKIKLSLEDLQFTKENGYAKGISNIFIKNLNDMDVTERPIHCSDQKRLQFYIKKEDKWEKDKKNEEIDKIKEQKSINSFLQGFLIAIFNPKILIWFSAVFSQFVKIDASFFSHSILVVTASVIDGMWYIIVTLLVTSYGMNNFFQKRFVQP